MGLRLTGRLGLICDMLPAGRCLCDVGTDHALIPAAAVLEGRYAKAVASDIRPGPLERAARTLRRHGLEDRISLRLGPGLEAVHPGECDCIVIAGMGALMITEILEACPETARRAACILLQPMHAQERLRPWLREHGFLLLEERLAVEGEKHYQVMSVCHATSVGGVGANPLSVTAHQHDEKDRGLPADPADTLYDRVGYGIVHRPDPHAAGWVNDWVVRQRRITEGLLRAEAPDGLREAQAILHQLELCLKALEGARDGCMP